jgi:protein phosphatase
VRAHTSALLEHRKRETIGDAAIVDDWPGLLAEVARRGLVDANRAILERQRVEPFWRGSGSTGVAGVFARGAAGLAHVGASRIYRARNDRLEPLTVDHSLLNEYIKVGGLTAEEIEAFPHKNVIVRALGMGEETAVDTSALLTEPGDLYLFCSDGITLLFDDGALLQALRQHGVGAAQFLVEEASGPRPGPTDVMRQDNVTAVVVAIGDRETGARTR